MEHENKGSVSIVDDEAGEVVARVEKHLTIHNPRKQLEEYNVRLRREIIERRRIETQLRESEEKYRPLFERMSNEFALFKAIYDEQGDLCNNRYHFLFLVDSFRTLRTNLANSALTIGFIRMPFIPAAAAFSLLTRSLNPVQIITGTFGLIETTSLAS